MNKKIEAALKHFEKGYGYEPADWGYGKVLARALRAALRDTERIDFMQSRLKGKVGISSADADGVITFHAFGSGLRQAIDAARKSGPQHRRREEGK